MESFKLNKKIKEAWVLYKDNFAIFFLWSACYILVKSIALKGVIFLPIIALILWILISYMIVRFILHTLDGKEFDLFSKAFLPTFKEAWNFIKTFVMLHVVSFSFFVLALLPIYLMRQSLFIGTINSMIAFAVIMVLSFIWTLFISIRLGFSCLISIDENIGFIKSFKRSLSITKNKFWSILWNYFLISCVFVLSSMIVGILFGMTIAIFAQIVLMAFVVPISLIVIILLYRSLISNQKKEE